MWYSFLLCLSTSYVVCSIGAAIFSFTSPFIFLRICCFCPACASAAPLPELCAPPGLCPARASAAKRLPASRPLFNNASGKTSLGSPSMMTARIRDTSWYSRKTSISSLTQGDSLVALEQSTISQAVFFRASLMRSPKSAQDASSPSSKKTLRIGRLPGRPPLP